MIQKGGSLGCWIEPLAILQCSLKIQADQAHCHLYSPGMQHEPETQPIGKEIPHIPFGDILYHQF